MLEEKLKTFHAEGSNIVNLSDIKDFALEMKKINKPPYNDEWVRSMIEIYLPLENPTWLGIVRGLYETVNSTPSVLLTLGVLYFGNHVDPGKFPNLNFENCAYGFGLTMTVLAAYKLISNILGERLNARIIQGDFENYIRRLNKEV